MRKVKYKQKTKSSKKNTRHKTRNNYAMKNNDARRSNRTRKCKKGETDETIRIRKLTEFVEGHNQMYKLLNKKYEDIKSGLTDKKNNKKE